MEVTGIICEYNPLHLGHKKQIDTVRAAYPDGSIVCLMSGNYVQRGNPAILDKSLRAKAALEAGADLVLEMPITVSLSSAEGFAAESVRILGGFCQRLCFGAECGNNETILATAKALLSQDFPEYLHQELDKGASFPVARQKALEAMGLSGALLSEPNNILAVEYCKAILSQGLAMEPMVIAREGCYHDCRADAKNPSATAVRVLMEQGATWEHFVPTDLFRGAVLHTLAAGEKAILYRLQSMTDEEFEALPYGSEGLWRKLMENARTHATLEEVLTATKSKRYTRTRLDRMVMCAFLGITEEMLRTPAPYVRVLALNDKGREILKAARETGHFPNPGESIDHPYQALEYRAGRLYSLFAVSSEMPQQEQERRIFYQR